MFSLSIQAGKGKGKEEEAVVSHHGVAYLNLSPLLYPGNTKIAGAFTLHHFSPSDVASKVRMYVDMELMAWSKVFLF